MITLDELKEALENIEWSLQPVGSPQMKMYRVKNYLREATSFMVQPDGDHFVLTLRNPPEHSVFGMHASIYGDAGSLFFDLSKCTLDVNTDKKSGRFVTVSSEGQSVYVSFYNHYGTEVDEDSADDATDLDVEDNTPADLSKDD